MIEKGKLRRTGMEWLSMFLLAFSINCVTNAQDVSGQIIIEEVMFSNIQPSLPQELIEPQIITINNSAVVNRLFFNGTITGNKFGNNLFSTTVQISGPGFADFEFRLNNRVNIPGAPFTNKFEASVDVAGSITSGDNVSFTFIDSFDQDSDGVRDVTIEGKFEFGLEAESNLGNFALNAGSYDRRGFGRDHVFKAVNFQVTADGDYSILSSWDDGIRFGSLFNGFLVILDQPFNGVDDTIGRIAFNDDALNSTIRSPFSSEIESVALREGIVYTALLTSSASSSNTKARGDLVIEGDLGNVAFLVPTETNLGRFVLDDGFYERRGLGNGEHPFRAVNFEVNDSGNYSITSNWSDGNGSSFDGFLLVLDQQFNGVNTFGVIGLNDNFNGQSTSNVENVFLQKNILYTAVLTSSEALPEAVNLEGELIIKNLEGDVAFLVEESKKLCFPVKNKNENFVMVCF